VTSRKGSANRKGGGGASSLADTVNKGVADRDLRAQERQDKKLCAATPECVLEEDEEVQVPRTTATRIRSAGKAGRGVGGR
jgi:hypothetical protein